MALTKTATLESGLTVTSGYYRIATVGGDKNSQSIALCLFVSKEASDEGKPCIDQQTYTFTPSVAVGSDNFIKQGYEYLKTLDAFADAADA